MAEAGAARHKRGARAASVPSAPRGVPQRAQAPELDSLIHHRLRLGILSALAATEALAFGDLKGILGATDGNLSVHARRLEDAGYVTCSKTFDGRRPRTEYRLAPRGRQALTGYLNHMEALIRATRGTLGR